VLDTRELGRRPGSSRKVSRSTSAPADLGIELMSVPEGEQIDLDLLLEAVMEGVLVTGSAQAEVSGECARCLEPIGESLSVDFCELFVYDDRDETIEDGELDVSRLEGDLLDLEPVLRDAVVLALPFQPLCQPDCPGLCPDCGLRLATDPEHTHEAPIDPRWAALTALHGEQSTQQDPESGQQA
jgi:uncharacterized protein